MHMLPLPENYEAPELIEFGTIDEITKGMDKGNADGTLENGPLS